MRTATSRVNQIAGMESHLLVLGFGHDVHTGPGPGQPSQERGHIAGKHTLPMFHQTLNMSSIVLLPKDHQGSAADTISGQPTESWPREFDEARSRLSRRSKAASSLEMQYSQADIQQYSFAVVAKVESRQFNSQGNVGIMGRFSFINRLGSTPQGRSCRRQVQFSVAIDGKRQEVFFRLCQIGPVPPSFLPNLPCSISIAPNLRRFPACFPTRWGKAGETCGEEEGQPWKDPAY